jgi:DNA primase
VALQRLVEAQGTELKRHGADGIGLYPFDNDYEPALVVDPRKIRGAVWECETGGFVID